MKVSERDDKRIVIAVLWIGFLALIFGGCTNVQHQVRLNKEYIPEENVSIKVAKVVNDTGFEFDIDIEDMMADALEDQLLEEGIVSILRRFSQRDYIGFDAEQTLEASLAEAVRAVLDGSSPSD